MDIPDSFMHSAIPTSQPQLPVEMLDHILGFIADYEEDKEREAEDALYAFSLASRSFRRIALPYVFRVLSLVIHAGAWQESMVDRLTKYLDHSIRRQLIQELRIHAVFTCSGNYTCDSADVDIVELVKLCQQLPKLRTLALYDIFLRDASLEGTEPLRNFQGTLPALDGFITTNEICTPCWVGISSILELLSCFAEVRRVCFEGITFFSWDFPNDRLSFPPSMRSLKVWSCIDDVQLLRAVIYDISERHVPILLQSLEICFTSSYFDKIIGLITYVGPSLLELSLDFDLFRRNLPIQESLGELQILSTGSPYKRIRSFDQVVTELRLSGCSSLMSFSLGWMFRTFEDNRQEHLVTQLCIVLSLLHECPSIREVTLRVCIETGDAQLAHEDFNAIAPRIEDELLKLKPLKTVKIELSYSSLWRHPPISKENFVRNLFPRLKEKGLLRVTLK